MALGSTQPLVKMSTRNIPGSKGGRCVRLRTSPPSRAGCHEIWEPKPPGTLWATPGLLRDSFTFTGSWKCLWQSLTVPLRRLNLFNWTVIIIQYFHKSPSLILVLSQMNPDHTVIMSSSKSRLMLSSHLNPLCDLHILYYSYRCTVLPFIFWQCETHKVTVTQKTVQSLTTGLSNRKKNSVYNIHWRGRPVAMNLNNRITSRIQ